MLNGGTTNMLAAYMLLCLMVMTGHSGAQHTSAAAKEQDAEQGAAAHATWRMEATAHVASLAIRNMYCKLEPERLCESLPLTKLWPLQRWAMTDAAWGRLLASLSNYELGRRFWQQQEYQRALEVVEWSIAYKLFPYEQDSELQVRWQHDLMGTSQAFKRPKLELADGLILMANCMYELGRRQSSVEHLYLSLEAIHLSATLMHNSMDLVQEVLSHLELLSQHVALALTQSLSRIKSSKLMELMVVYGAQCQSCVERRDFVEALLSRLSLPVRYEAGGAGTALEVTHPTFVHDAYVRQQGEQQEQFTRRLMQQLVGMVRLGLLSDLNVPCTKWSDERDCESHMPGWMYSMNKSGGETSSSSSRTIDGVSSSGASASIPAASASSRTTVGSSADGSEQPAASSSSAAGSSTWGGLGDPPLPPDPAVLIDALYTGNMQQDLRRLHWTLDLLLGQPVQAAAARAAGQGALAPGGAGASAGASAWASAAAAWGAAQETQDPADLGQLDWQTVPPFPPPPALMPGLQYKSLGLMPPLPFKPPKPTTSRPPSYKKVYEPASQNHAIDTEPSVPMNLWGQAGAHPPAPHDAPPPSASGSMQERQGATSQPYSPSCCDPYEGGLACCDAADSSVSGRSSSVDFGPWLQTRGVWPSFSDASALPSIALLLPMQLAKGVLLVLLLLAGLSAAVLLSYTMTRHRQPIGHLVSRAAGLLGLQAAAPATSPVPASGLSSAGGAQRPGMPALAQPPLCAPATVAPAPPSSDVPLAAQRRKAAAAALKEVLAAAVAAAPSPRSGSGAGVARLEAALLAAEAAGLQDAALMQRAEAALAELRRRPASGASAATNASSSSTPSSNAARQRGRGRHGVTPASSTSPSTGRQQPASQGGSPAEKQAHRPPPSEEAPVGPVSAAARFLVGLVVRCLGSNKASASACSAGLVAGEQPGMALPPQNATTGSGAAANPAAPRPPAAGQPAPNLPTTLTATYPANLSASLVRGEGKLKHGLPGSKLGPSLAPGDHDVHDPCGDPGSPQSTSTGSSSFAERISHSSTGPLPAAATAPTVPLPPAYNDFALYDWETLPPELTADVGWQEGRKKRGNQAACSKLKPGATSTPEPQPQPQQAATSLGQHSIDPALAALLRPTVVATQLPLTSPAKPASQLGASAAPPPPPPGAAAASLAARPAAPRAAAAPGAPAAKPKAVLSQLLPSSDAVILTCAKPVKTKLGPVGSKAPGSATAADTPSQPNAWASQPGEAATPVLSRSSTGTRAALVTPGSQASPSPSSSFGRQQSARGAQTKNPVFANSQSFSPSPSHPGAPHGGLPSLSSLSLSPTCMSPGVASSAARCSPEQLAAMYGYPPPPPPPPPRTSPANSNPALGAASSPHASPIKAGTPAESKAATSPAGTPLVPGDGPGEPNPFAQPAAAMLAAAPNTAAAAAFAAKPHVAPTTPTFGQAEPQSGAQRQVSSAKAFSTSPLNPFGGKPLGNGALGLQLGSFHSADYDSLSLMDKAVGEPGSARCTGSPRMSLQQQQYGQYKGLSTGGAFMDAPGAAAFAQPDGTAAAPLSPLLFSSSVWSNTAVGAADNGGSWISHSASVPLADARTSSGGSVCSAGGNGGPAAATAAAGMPAGSWLSHLGTGPAPASSIGAMSSSLWSTATATLFGASSGGTWGAPLGGMSLGSPSPAASSLAPGLPQIPSESDLTHLGLVAFGSEADGLLGSSPEATEAPDWAHQIMRVVE